MLLYHLLLFCKHYIFVEVFVSCLNLAHDNVNFVSVLNNKILLIDCHLVATKQFSSHISDKAAKTSLGPLGRLIKSGKVGHERLFLKIQLLTKD